jgi:hypothetical protein
LILYLKIWKRIILIEAVAHEKNDRRLKQTESSHW